MKGINRTGAALVHVPGWVGGWMGEWVDGWMEVKAVLRIAYSNQKFVSFFQKDSYSLLKDDKTQEKESNQQVAQIIESQQQQLREQERKNRQKRKRK
jgi:hypothetical protein